MLDLMLQDVERFNREVIGLPVPEAPRVLSGDRREFALQAMAEELGEFTDASERGDVAEAADALVDLIYFAMGRLLEMGVPPGPVWEVVQAANMAKERGQLSKRPNSLGYDAVKPEGWTAPDHSWLLHVQIEDLRHLVGVVG